jgi:ribose transport system substrate-binding protein
MTSQYPVVGSVGQEASGFEALDLTAPALADTLPTDQSSAAPSWESLSMMRNLFLALTAATAAAAACLGLAGCRSKGPDTDKGDYKYVIAVIPKGVTHEFWKSIERGAKRAAADLAALGISVQVLYDGPRKESDAQEQIGLVQQMVSSRGISGLVLAPQDSKGMVGVVQETVDANIPVVIIDSGLDQPELMIKYIATDNFKGGKLAAEHLLNVLKKEGKTAPKLVLFRYAVGSESTEQREKGFLARINAEIIKQKAGRQPTIEIISDNVYAGATVDSAQAAAGPLLIKVKDKVDGIFAVNESATSGMLNALRSQELNKKVHLVGFDSADSLLQALEQGDIDGLIVQDPYRMGYLGVWTMVRHLEGDDVSVGGKKFSTGEHLVTKDKLHAKETRELFDAEFQSKRKIELPSFKKK